MSKICSNCGVKYSNSAKKCIMCGTEFNDEHIYAKRKRFIILGIVGALLIGAVIALVVFSTGPKAAVRRVMESQKRNDPEATIAMFPSFFVESDLTDKEALLRDVSEMTEALSQYLFSYNIEKAADPTTKEVEEYMEVFRYFGGEDFREEDIEDIKIVWVNYKGNIPSFWPSHATRFVMIKYEGKWCWWPSNVGR